MIEQDFKDTPTPNDKQLAMWAHLIGTISCVNGLFGLIGTLIFYIVNRDKSSFVKEHTAQALNFQIIYFIFSLIIGFFTLGAIFTSFFLGGNNMGANMGGMFAGFGLTILINLILVIVNLAVCIKAALSANKGEIWDNPLAFKLIR